MAFRRPSYFRQKTDNISLQDQSGGLRTSHEAHHADSKMAFGNEHEVDPNSISDAQHDRMLNEVKATLRQHEMDPNYPDELLAKAREVISGDVNPNADRKASIVSLVNNFETERALIQDDSPYPEVRAVVDPVDNGEPVNTFRAWVLGIFFVFIGTGIDQFFSLRYPGIYVTSFCAQLISFPMGVAMAKILPTRPWNIFGWSFTLNPGPFNQKEHMLITVMSNVSYGGNNGTAYVTYIFQVLKLDMFYGEKALADSAGFQILLALSTQLIGYGAAGITRRFLVYPAVMVWPKALAQIALNKALHNDNGDIVSGWTITRQRFFLYTFCGMFVYFWFPDFIFEGISYFNWITWIAPNNLNLAIITGSICGMGLNPWPTFDWNIASYLIDPIITPWFALLNVGVGMFFLGFVIIVPMFYSNVWNTAYFPINSNYVYDNTGAEYNITKVLNTDFSLNLDDYLAYSPAYLSAGNGVLYSAFFGVYLATVVYVGLYHWKEIKMGVVAVYKWNNARDDHDDVHNRLMRNYKECPEWWYLVLLAISFMLACICVEVWHTAMPIWGLVFAILLCFALQIPIGMIYAISNVEVTNNVLAEFVGGYAIPNKPIANMIFKSFGYIACAQSVQFAQDLKLGHYMKIPPRLMFSAQTIATIIGAFVSIGVNAWQLDNIVDICSATQPQKFTCPGSHTFFTASVIWGAIGPKRIYGDGGIYHPLEYGFLVGALLPVPFYFAAKRWPNSWVKYVHVPILLYGGLNWAPYNFSFMWPGLMVGFVVNYWVKRHHLAWWQKYAYVLTSSFAVGIAISAVVIFFAVQYEGYSLDWWGNTVSFDGIDGLGTCVLKTVAAGEHF